MFWECASNGVRHGGCVSRKRTTSILSMGKSCAIYGGMNSERLSETQFAYANSVRDRNFHDRFLNCGSVQSFLWRGKKPLACQYVRVSDGVVHSAPAPQVEKNGSRSQPTSVKRGRLTRQVANRGQLFSPFPEFVVQPLQMLVSRPERTAAAYPTHPARSAPTARSSPRADARGHADESNTRRGAFSTART